MRVFLDADAIRQGTNCMRRQLGESPAATGSDGVIRIDGTRSPLDTVIGAFQDGATAEEVAQQYPSATLGVVYQVIG